MSIEPGPTEMGSPLAGTGIDDRTRMAIGSGVAVAIIGLLASIVDATELTYAGLILILAGLMAAGAAYASSMRAGAAAGPVAMRDLILAGGTIGAILGILYIFELLFDLDHVEDYGGAVGAIVTVALGIAGVVLYLAATRWWTGGPLAPWTVAVASGGRATRLVFAGAALVVVGWLGNVTIGFWYLDAGAEVTAFILLAALAMRAANDPDQPMRLPFPADYIALALSAVAAIIALQHTSALLEEGADLEHWIAQGLYVVGVGVTVVGAVLGAMDAMRSADGNARTPAGPS